MTKANVKPMRVHEGGLDEDAIERLLRELPLNAVAVFHERGELGNGQTTISGYGWILKEGENRFQFHPYGDRVRAGQGYYDLEDMREFIAQMQHNVTLYEAYEPIDLS